MTTHTRQQLGNYRLIHLLGQGGFADVYLGEHVYLKTQAAIKVLRVQLTSEEQERFLSEARLIAHLEHPHIVSVLEFGVEDGTPYLVMDYAPHGTLRQRHPKDTRLPLTSVLSYVKQIAAALQYAHSEKLIYRDVKPENMLIGRNDEILLSDFGVALVAQGAPAENEQRVVGTIAYMAPEQLRGRACPASDQYALGAVIYEWLCGGCPFQGSFTEIATQHALIPPPPLREKVPTIPPLVEEVVLIALAKDPGQRFATMRAFANAFEQACQSEEATSTPVSAQRSPWYKRRLSRRTVGLGLAGIVAVTGLAVAGIRIIQPFESLPPLGSTIYTYHGHLSPSSVTWAPDSKRIASLGNADGIQVWNATTGQPIFFIHDVYTVTMATAWSLDGKYIAYSKADYPANSFTVHIQDATTDHTIFTYRGHAAPVNAVTWSPDSKRIASACGIADPYDPRQEHDVQVWDATTGDHVYTYRGQAAAVIAVAWSPNGKFIASVCGENFSGSVSKEYDVQVWDAVTGHKFVTYPAKVNAIAWSPDSKHISSASPDGTVQVWDAITGHKFFIYSGHTDVVNTVSWSPGGTRIASGSNDKTVQIWDAATGRTIFTYRGHFGPVRAVAWSPDGTLIASASDDGTVQIWQGI